MILLEGQISTPSSSLHELKRAGTFLGLQWHSPLYILQWQHKNICNAASLKMYILYACASVNSGSVRYNVICYFGIHPVKVSAPLCFYWQVLFAVQCFQSGVQCAVYIEVCSFCGLCALCFVLHGVQCTVCIVLDITEGAGSDISRVSRQTALTAGTPLELQCTAVHKCVL